MPTLPSPFKSPDGEARFLAAYEATLRLWTTPYEPMDISSRFGLTHLVACGPKEAPPLVLLHSFYSSLTGWAYNLPDLSRHYRVYALDVMGQPSRSIPDQPITRREHFAEWLTTILDALKIEKTHLAGMSYGGWITLNQAMSTPERLGKIVLISPAGSFLPLRPQFYLRAMLLSLPPSRYWMSSFVGWMTHRPNLQDPAVRQLFDRLVDQMDLGTKYFSTRSGVLPGAYTDEELRRVRNPVLLLIGQQEVIYSPAGSIARAQRLVPSLRGELIPEARHDIVFSQARVVDQKMLEFLGD